MHARWQIRENEKVCGVDIDDVLADSTKFWLRYLNSMVSKKYDDLDTAKNEIPYNAYRRLKSEYRSCGVKKKIPVMDGAKEFLDGLKKKGYKVLLLTARPFEVHRELFKITVDWLSNNNLQYDGIIWGENKNFKIIMEVPNLSFMVENHSSLADQIAKLSYKVFLLTNRYNEGKPVHDNVTRVNKLSEILEVLK